MFTLYKRKINKFNRIKRRHTKLYHGYCLYDAVFSSLVYAYTAARLLAYMSRRLC